MDRISTLKEYLQSTPDDSFLKHALALEYIKEGNDKEAELLFEDLLKKDENYVGSYYHFGKLLERNGKTREAIACYQKGMQKARQAGEQRTYNELSAAYEDLVY